MANTKFKLETVEVRNSDKVGEYLVGTGTLLKKDGTKVPNQSVRVFKENIDAVKKFFKAGRKVELHCMPFGRRGSFKVLGLRKEATSAEAPAEAVAA